MYRKLSFAALALAAGIVSSASAQIPGDNAPLRDNPAAVPGDNRPIQDFAGNLGNRGRDRVQVVRQNAPIAPFSGGLIYDYSDGYARSSTALGDALTGAGDLIRSTGEAVRNGSEAAVNIEVAKSQYLRNNYDASKTFWEKRLLWAENTAYFRGRTPSGDQLRQMARDAAPDRLSVVQLSPVTGEINWPAGLLRPEYDNVRRRLEDIFANRTVTNSGVGSTSEVAVSRLTDAMLDDLKSQIGEMTPSEYIVAKNFLRSLSYETRFMPGAENLARR